MNTYPIDPLDDPEQPAAKRQERVEASDQWVIWDIETAPLKTEQLLAQMPAFKAAANLEDPEKIAASIEEKKSKYMAEAALSPISGRVVAVGLKHSHGETKLINGEDEAMVVAEAVGYINGYIGERIKCIGFNIHSFDLPFLRFRALVHGLKVPLWTTYTGRAYWSPQFRDLLPELVMGRDFAGYNLDAVSKALGIGGKTGDGAMFYETYKMDQKKALDYLLNDLVLTERLAIKMGVAG